MNLQTAINCRLTEPAFRLFAMQRLYASLSGDCLRSLKTAYLAIELVERNFPSRNYLAVRYFQGRQAEILHADRFHLLQELADRTLSTVGITHLIITGSDVSWHVWREGGRWVQEAIGHGEVV